MRNTIAGISLILASVVCVVLFVSLERPRPGIDSAYAKADNSGWVWQPGGYIPFGGVYPGQWQYYRGNGYYSTDYGRGYYSFDNFLPPVVLPDPKDESVKAIHAALDCRDIRLNIDDTTTFHDLFLMIKDELRRLELPDIHIAMDIAALKDANEIRSDTIVCPNDIAVFPPMRLRSMLSNLLEPLELDYTIRNELLLITTKEKVYAEGENKWNKDRQDKSITEWEDMWHKRESAPERTYKMSMRTYKMLTAGLAIAWLAYFISGLCLLIVRDKPGS